MKATILNFLRAFGLKVFTDWWNGRGKDKVGDFKDEILDFVNERLDIVEKELKATYGIRESIKDHILVRDQGNGKIIKIYVADNHIKSESYEDKADK
jgi:hypothetical protein